MLDKVPGKHCQATNFLKTFSSIREAGSMGLLEEESRDKLLSGMIQSLTRFLLKQVSQDYINMYPAPPMFDQTFSTSAIESVCCMRCKTKTVRPGDTYVNELTYPFKTVAKGQAKAVQFPFRQILKISMEGEKILKGWCNNCNRYSDLSSKKTINRIPQVLLLNAAANTMESKKLWASPGWLPEEIGIILDSGQIYCYEGEELRIHLRRGLHHITLYELVGFVADITKREGQASHLVSLINVALSSPQPQAESDWHVFNDFRVDKVSFEEALRFEPSWKVPSVIGYQIKAARHKIDDSWKKELGPQKSDSYRLLTPEEAPQQGTIVALDAEFVALKQEEIEIKADGTRETIRPARLGLARVSVLRGSGNLEAVPFIDDYIATTEPVVDYLTAYSGIKPGDLDRRISTKNVVSLKIAYKKLWILLNLGCVFVGHGLTKDFRTINIQVPKEQVFDTVVLFHKALQKRKLSLRFLSWYLLREEIQEGEHDSIEDSRTALKLYRKYQEFEDAGVFETILNDIYSKGRETNFKAPGALRTQSDSYNDRRGTDSPDLIGLNSSTPGPRTPTPMRGQAGLQVSHAHPSHLQQPPPSWPANMRGLGQGFGGSHLR
ncbi:MAG: poly(A)-specific ribonuclease [Trizodia sp. TS-e1964]|nr:MAG: poly(A)-specific ribonuclease [Trizodia sp. TS-e1964]